MGMLVNEATVEDSAGIAHVNVASWRHAYAHLLSPGFLASISEEDIASNFRRGLERGRSIWVGRVDDQIVGFAMAATPREPNPPRDLELGLIYVLPAHYGNGLAQALLDAAIGSAPCMLGRLGQPAGTRLLSSQRVQPRRCDEDRSAMGEHASVPNDPLSVRLTGIASVPNCWPLIAAVPTSWDAEW
ncbi:GNAT family N-acetyltransferase [Cryobacterium sp. TMT1-2-1]|uniref:GNAT family N-acetyltransferase n=1 Tax=Cryobacterium sp. TMT1-2-1 TaxID=1259232 RepID=UPI00106A9251|nr:GNAT family N-acetyltransferase [Cryobacterium sp. TMT1-2-1]TFD43239.1 GNAT family N-acetyltransferase [Cryobacterium sp. TMT1-2-1]